MMIRHKNTLQKKKYLGIEHPPDLDWSIWGRNNEPRLDVTLLYSLKTFIELNELWKSHKWQRKHVLFSDLMSRPYFCCINLSRVDNIQSNTNMPSAWTWCYRLLPPCPLQHRHTNIGEFEQVPEIWNCLRGILCTPASSHNNVLIIIYHSKVCQKTSWLSWLTGIKFSVAITRVGTGDSWPST